MASFQYHGRSKEDVTRRAKQSSGRFDSYIGEDVTWFRPKPGENCIRLIPWLLLDKKDKRFAELDERWGNHWGIDIIVHRNVGPDNGAYLCLDKMKGEPCPVCDAWRGDDLEALKPSDRVLCWLIDRNDEKAGPQLWSMPLGVSKDISACSQDKRSGETLLIDDWDEGYDVYFDKEGDKDRTQYKRPTLARDPSPLAENQKTQDAWLSYCAEKLLPDLLKFYETEYLDKVLSGQKERGEGDGKPEGNVRELRRRRDEGDGGNREETSGRGGRGAREEEPAAEERPLGRRRRGEEEPSEREEPSSRGGRRRGEEPEEPTNEAENEASEARDWGHRGRTRAAEAEVETPTRERRRPRGEVSEPEPDNDRSPEAARGRLERLGRRR